MRAPPTMHCESGTVDRQLDRTSVTARFLLFTAESGTRDKTRTLLLCHRSLTMPRTFLATALLSLALTLDLSAQRSALPSSRVIAEYNVDDVTLRVSADAPRVEVFLWRKPQAILVYLDSRAIERWADSAAVFLREELRSPDSSAVERSTPILRHADTSYRSGLMFTRHATNRTSRLFLTAWVGDHSAAMVPMRVSQARGFLAALREAAHVARRSR